MAGTKLHPAMTFNGLRSALQVYKLKPYDMAVYLVIMLHMNGRTGKGSCPSYSTIGTEGNMTARQAMKSVKVLVEKGLITVEKQKGNAKKRAGNVYALSMPSILPATSEQGSHEQGSHEQGSLGDVNMVHSASEQRSHKKESVKRIPKKDKSAAANAAPKPKRERKSKPVDTTPAIPAHDYQAAFIAGFGFSDAAYRDTEFLGDIKRAYVLMDQVGLTPAAVPAFLEFVREKENGRAPKAKYLKDSVLAFEAKYSAENAYESRFFSILPNTNPEFPNGLPIGISPDEPMADVYRVQPDQIDPEWESFIAAKVKENDDFITRYFPDTAA
jgi:predicted transcriptional regulator